MDQCPHCKITYDEFHTGYTYKDIYYLIYTRKYKRRNGVLGYWHQLKLEMWKKHVEECERKNENEIFISA